MRCSFCGSVFDKNNAEKGCNGCPFQGGCRKIKCPNCGFEMPEEPAWIRKLRSIGGIKVGKSVKATELKKGTGGIVSELDTADTERAKKLMALGILPGMPIKAVQKFPTWVFQIGNTQVALDNGCARCIKVDIQD